MRGQDPTPSQIKVWSDDLDVRVCVQSDNCLIYQEAIFQSAIGDEVNTEAATAYISTLARLHNIDPGRIVPPSYISHGTRHFDKDPHADSIQAMIDQVDLAMAAV